MPALNLAENIIRLRHQRGITQEALANFMGVTKASVSKWETEQSCPDILLLPQLASFFGVSLDALLGYEPQLSREQIKVHYHLLAADFAAKPFEEVMENSWVLVKKYYACYPFLQQICVLWLNHFTLAPEEARQAEILQDVYELCTHILENSKDVSTGSGATYLRAMVDLQCGRPRAAIDALEDLCDPYRFGLAGDSLLTQSYLAVGETEKADSFMQISLYGHLMEAIGCMMQYLQIHAQEPERCDLVLSRADRLLEIFSVEGLNPNVVAGFQYQAAAVRCAQGNTDEALARLERFAREVRTLLDSGPILHGDNFFFRLDTWFENSDLGVESVRDKRLIAKTVLEALDNPAFAPIAQTPRFKNICRILKG